MGSDRSNFIRKFGYGLKGIPPVSYNLSVSGKRISAIGVLSSCGMEDAYTIKGSVNGETFLEFVCRSLIPGASFQFFSHLMEIIHKVNCSMPASITHRK